MTKGTTDRHTPGPWKIKPLTKPYDTENEGAGRFIEKFRITMDVPGCPGVESILAETCGSHTEEEHEANARLIAAAPDLLEACKAARTIDTVARTSDREAIMTLLDSAISKAEGK